MNDAAFDKTREATSEIASIPQQRLGVTTLGRYLLGERAAIVAFSQSKTSLWLGLLLVIAAGFAREYDAEYLLAEPWHLLLPLGASITSSVILFLLILIFVSHAETANRSIRRSYRHFLSLYWLTAPLAWLYAIPVERFLSKADSVRANLTLLGIVAAWRVVLMIRIVSLLYAPSRAAAAVVVLTFADALMLVILYLTPIPIIQIMGGVRLTEAESILQATVFLLGLIGVVSGGGLLLSFLTMLLRSRSDWTLASAAVSSNRFVSPGLWALTIASLLIWIPLLPGPQREQSLKWQVETEFANKDIGRGLRIMSEHHQSDFPPHWSPPPHIAYAGSDSRRLLEIIDQSHSSAAADWVHDLYAEKLLHLLADDFAARSYWSSITDEEAALFVKVVEQLPARHQRALFRGSFPFATDPKVNRRKYELASRLQELHETMNDSP